METYRIRQNGFFFLYKPAQYQIQVARTTDFRLNLVVSPTKNLYNKRTLSPNVILCGLEVQIAEEDCLVLLVLTAAALGHVHPKRPIFYITEV